MKLSEARIAANRAPIARGQMISRREFMAGSVALAVASNASREPEPESILVNDIHSQLNPTRVLGISQPRSKEDVQSLVRMARKDRKVISVAGGRHAMGGQQFGTDTLLVDIRKLNRVLQLDRKNGILEVEAGIEWPELIGGYLNLQNGDGAAWGIAQKQTGADRFTMAGTIAANAHGRGLKLKPFVSDVESFVLVDATGTAQRCSRRENPELFRLVHGGYGLFGVVTSLQLRLTPRKKVERVVEIRTVDDLIAAFERRVADGFLYGDFQFSIEPASDDFLHKGVFSCYRPVSIDTPIPPAEKQLTDENWRQLLYLAHTDKKQAYDRYADYYLSTNGQVYWSDLHQLSIYPENYHREIDDKLHAPYPATEMITEINVPRPALKGFFDEVREDFRKHGTELIYGTVRLIERDEESFLPWAKQPYACTIFNLHTIHSLEGTKRSEYAFRRLIDMAARRGGTYYLTYHRYATRNQVESCYPQFAEFLRLKRKYDPQERFQSEWYRHYRTMFADSL
jgi:FAD/FMN-containing dehydrogenase